MAKAIEFKDKFENIGAQLLRQVASNTNDIAGDGTTTATVLTRAIYSEGCKSIAAGMNPMDLRRRINMAVGAITTELGAMSQSIDAKEKVAQKSSGMSKTGSPEVELDVVISSSSILVEPFVVLFESSSVLVKSSVLVEFIALVIFFTRGNSFGTVILLDNDSDHGNVSSFDSPEAVKRPNEDSNGMFLYG